MSIFCWSELCPRALNPVLQADYSESFDQEEAASTLKEEDEVRKTKREKEFDFIPSSLSFRKLVKQKCRD